jgi:HSP20 family protein
MYGRCSSAGQRSAYYRNTSPFSGGYRRPKYNVPVNIDEKETHFELAVYATGFDKANIKLTVTDDVLYITGTRSIAEGQQYHFTKQEFPVKSFERMIGLNGQVDANGITARQENGVLLVTLPKSAAATAPAQEIKVD